MHSQAASRLNRNYFFHIIFVLVAISWLYTAPPVHGLTLGLADNTTYNIFFDTNDPDPFPNFQGTLTTGVNEVTNFQVAMGLSFFDFTAPFFVFDDDIVAINNASQFFIIDTTLPGFDNGAILSLSSNGTWSGFWFPGPEVICLTAPGCTWTATAVPESVSLLLFGFGLVGFSLLCRKLRPPPRGK